MSDFQPIIGLEIHVQPKTISKMFCGCSASYFGKPANTQVCPVCLGLPGSLPVPNSLAIKQTIRLGLALGCEIAEHSKFDRKHYFYPDLPKGYQISQYDLPLCQKGEFEGVQVRRVHLEEDTGKLLHQGRDTLIDFNRCGVPLIEIVTEPDLYEAASVKKFLQKLRHLIRWIEVSEADMEKGSMRLEPNVSVKKIKNPASPAGRQRSKIKDPNQNSKIDQELPPYKVEIKNINSFRFVEKAINFEIQRQIEILKRDGMPIQETRGWVENKGITVSQRTKEEAHDYRYFPEPDIPPLEVNDSLIKKLKNELGELPKQAQARLIRECGLSSQETDLVSREKSIFEYFKRLLLEGVSAKEAARIVIHKPNLLESEPKVVASHLKAEKESTVVLGTEIAPIVEKVLQQNPKAAADFQGGKSGALQFLIGQVMKQTKGKTDPQLTSQLLKERLS